SRGDRSKRHRDHASTLRSDPRGYAEAHGWSVPWRARGGAVAAGDQAPAAQEREVGVSLAARKIRLIMGLRRAGVTDSNVLNALENAARRSGDAVQAAPN